jgi:hypothetical protein
MDFRRLVMLAVVLSLLIFPSACQNRDSPQLTFGELFSRPESYNEKEITIEGYFWQGWETIVFSEELDYFMSSRRALAPGGRMMWVEGGIPKDIYDRLYTQQSPGPVERFGKVKITGEFHYGGEYGHLGGFKAEIAPAKVEILDWTPPP